MCIEMCDGKGCAREAEEEEELKRKNKNQRKREVGRIILYSGKKRHKTEEEEREEQGQEEEKELIRGKTYNKMRKMGGGEEREAGYVRRSREGGGIKRGRHFEAEERKRRK